MKKYIVGVLIVILGLLIYFAPFGFAHVCGPKADGGFMKCYWMGQAVRMLGGLVAVLGVIFLAFRDSRVGIAFSNIGNGVCLILLQTVVIGTCKHAAMQCNTYTKPVVLLLAIVLIALDAGYLFLSRKK